MRLLIDECLPRALQRLLQERLPKVQEMGWSSKENGELLSLAETEFDALLTMDPDFEHQQNPSRRRIAIPLLVARSNQSKICRQLFLPLSRLSASLAPVRQSASRRFKAIERQALRKLDLLDAAPDLRTLSTLPGNRLEKLKGDREGQHSIHINDK